MDLYDGMGSDPIAFAKTIYRFTKSQLKESKTKHRVLSILNLQASILQSKTFINLLEQRKQAVTLQHTAYITNYDEAIAFLRKFLPHQVPEFENVLYGFQSLTNKYFYVSPHLKNMADNLTNAINSLLTRIDDTSLFPSINKQTHVHEYSVINAFRVALSNGVNWIVNKQLETRTRIYRMEQLLHQILSTEVTNEEVDYDVADTIRLTNEFIDNIESVPRPHTGDDWRHTDLLLFLTAYKGTLDEFVYRELPPSMRKYRVNIKHADAAARLKQVRTEYELRNEIDTYRRNNALLQLNEAFVGLIVSVLQKDKQKQKESSEHLHQTIYGTTPLHATIEQVSLIQGVDVPQFVSDMISSLKDNEIDEMLTIFVFFVCFVGVCIGGMPRPSMWHSVFISSLALTNTFTWLLDNVGARVVRCLSNIVLPTISLPIMLGKGALDYLNVFDAKDTTSIFDGPIEALSRYSRFTGQLFGVAFSKTVENLTANDLGSIRSFVQSLVGDPGEYTVGNVYRHALITMMESDEILKNTLTDPTKRQTFFITLEKVVGEPLKSLMTWREHTSFNDLSYSTQSIFVQGMQYTKATPPRVANTTLLNVLYMFTNAPYFVSFNVGSVAAHYLPAPIEDGSFWPIILVCAAMIISAGRQLFINADSRVISPEWLTENQRDMHTIKDTATIRQDGDSAFTRNFLGFSKYGTFGSRIPIIMKSVSESRYVIPNLILPGKLRNFLVQPPKNASTSSFFDGMLLTLASAGVAGIVGLLTASTVGELMSDALMYGAIAGTVVIPSVYDVAVSFQNLKIKKQRLREEEKTAIEIFDMAANTRDLMTITHRGIAFAAAISRLLTVTLPYAHRFSLLQDSSLLMYTTVGLTVAEPVFNIGIDWLTKKRFEVIDIDEQDVHVHVYYTVQCIALVWADIMGEQSRVPSKMMAMKNVEYTPGSIEHSVTEWVNRRIFNANPDDIPGIGHFEEIHRLFLRCVDRLMEITDKHRNFRIREFVTVYTKSKIKLALETIGRQKLQKETSWRQLVIYPFYAILPYTDADSSRISGTEVHREVGKDGDFTPYLYICDALVKEYSGGAELNLYVNDNYRYKQAYLLSEVLFPKESSDPIEEAMRNIISGNYANDLLMVCISGKNGTNPGLFKDKLYQLISRGLRLLSPLTRTELVLRHYTSLQKMHEFMYKQQKKLDLIKRNANLGYELMWLQRKQLMGRIPEDECIMCVFGPKTFFI